MAKEVIGKVTVLGQRLSFASLFEPNVQKQDDGTTRETWKTNLLIAKDTASEQVGVFKGKRMPLLDALKAASEEAKEKKWGPKAKQPKLKPDRVFLRDGDLEDWEGYADNFYISANASLSDRPSVITNRKDGNGNWIEAEPGGRGSPYSGCFVNAVLLIWCQDNEHGKRVNAQVKAVQFFKDGEAFGAAPVNPNEEFTDDMAGEEGSIGGDFDEGGDDDEGEEENSLV